MLEGFCLAVFLLPFFSRGYTLHVFHLCFVPVLFSFVIFVVSLHMCVCLLASGRKRSKTTQEQNTNGKAAKQKPSSI
jgi:membrane protein implicated in regulation of membrane protease activity